MFSNERSRPWAEVTRFKSHLGHLRMARLGDKLVICKMVSRSYWFHTVLRALDEWSVKCWSSASPMVVVVVALVTQSCPTLCDPMNYILPSSSVHGILQERIIEWVALPFFRVSSRPRDQPWSPALQADSLPSELQGSPLPMVLENNNAG